MQISCFVVVCCWLVIFEWKQKRKFIPFLFTIWEVIVKNVSHTTDLVEYLDPFNLSEFEVIESFYPEGLLGESLVYVRYGKLFPRVIEQS